MNTMKRLVIGLMATWSLCSGFAWGQLKLVDGTWANAKTKPSQPEIKVELKAGSSDNFTVRGAIRTFNSQGAFKELIMFSGTLYKTGILRARVDSPAKHASTWTVNGTFDKATGQIKLAIRYPQRYDGGTRSGYYISNYTLTNASMKPEKEVYWVLKAGSPRMSDDYTKNPTPLFTISGTSMIYPSYSYKDGKPVRQVLTFSDCKTAYKEGEMAIFWVDASGTDKDAMPPVPIAMYFGFTPGIHRIFSGSDKSEYNLKVNFRSETTIPFKPSSEKDAWILVGAPGQGGLIYEYEREERIKKPEKAK
ncbi:MAG: hypothetical protein HUU60_07440 [Armatimonadetes bacterium]|nr:hypothetical protein [Armatimonadota bacterium]